MPTVLISAKYAQGYAHAYAEIFSALNQQRQSYQINNLQDYL